MAAVDYEIFDGLKLTLQGAYVNNLQNYNYFQKYIKYNENKESDPSQLDERFYKWDRTNYDALLNYNKISASIILRVCWDGIRKI